jgi:hypothetical protein
MAKTIKKAALPVVRQAHHPVTEHDFGELSRTAEVKESHIEKIEEALKAMEILYRVPQNLQGDNFINIIHHFEDVIKKNIAKLVNH